MKRPYRDFNLPVQHLTDNNHYVPPKARSSEEIERRRSQPKGVVLAEQQYRGMLIGARILRKVEDEPDVTYAYQLLAASGMSSAWYLSARDSETMSKRFKLPVLARGEDDTLFQGLALQEQARVVFDDAIVAAQGLLSAVETNSPLRGKKTGVLGKTLGNASLALACVPAGEAVRNFTPFMTQAWVREQGMGVLQKARAMAANIGTPPSFAQLADPNSDLAVEIRRNAPNVVEQAYEEGVTLYAMPR